MSTPKEVLHGAPTHRTHREPSLCGIVCNSSSLQILRGLTRRSFIDDTVHLLIMRGRMGKVNLLSQLESSRHCDFRSSQGMIRQYGVKATDGG